MHCKILIICVTLFSWDCHPKDIHKGVIFAICLLLFCNPYIKIIGEDFNFVSYVLMNFPRKNKKFLAKKKCFTAFNRRTYYITDPIVIEYPTEEIVIDLKKGDKVNLGVMATTDPSLSLTYSWYFMKADDAKEGTTPAPEEVRNNAYWTVFNNDKNLTIDSSMLNEAVDFYRVIGTYRVQISHRYDAEFVKFVITTTDVKPRKFPMPHF